MVVTLLSVQVQGSGSWYCYYGQVYTCSGVQMLWGRVGVVVTLLLLLSVQVQGSRCYRVGSGSHFIVCTSSGVRVLVLLLWSGLYLFRGPDAMG